MRVSQYPLNTLKEIPADAEIVSHQLMLRAGLIRKLANGCYTWLPLGLRVLQKVEKVIREEMNRAGGLEILMPTVIPGELWQESERWQQYGPELLRFKDRHDRDYCYGPTHEEVITDLARRELVSYKQLPINYYQIQLKFRDEIRPRFGVMRAREFIMKDAYSFHTDEVSLDETYRIMHQTYSTIFTRLGLKFRAVRADSGAIGGDASQEFHVLADSGEDAIVFSTESDYAANMEMAEALDTGETRPAAKESLETVDTPNQHSIEEVATFLKKSPQQCVKTLLVKGTKSEVIALLLRGDHNLNEVKASKLSEVAQPIEFADAAAVQKIAGCLPGSLGPMGLNIPIIADKAVMNMSDFVCGANEDGKHYTGANWERDLPLCKIADIRNVIEGDLSPDGKGTLKIARGIEVGHIFQLGQKYSKALQATVLDEAGKSIVMHMGCYGIGVTRVVAAAIEQNHDQYGIKWPAPIAPFQVALIPINMHKSTKVQEATEKLYQKLSEAGYEVLMDDRDARPGFKFADMELIGIPHRIVIGDKSLENGEVEYKSRDGAISKNITFDKLNDFLAKNI